MKISYDKYYNEKYWTGQLQYHEGFKLKNYAGPSLDWDGWEVVAQALQFVLFPGAGKTLLDVGCGGAGLTKLLLKLGYDAFGTDISEYAITAVAKGDMADRLAVVDMVKPPANIVSMATRRPFPTKFDYIVATDFLEHIYEEHLDGVLDWIRTHVSHRVFFCVATAHDPSHPGAGIMDQTQEVVLRAGEEIPHTLEAVAVSGHVNVRRYGYWVKKFVSSGFSIRWDMMYLFQAMREANPAWRTTWGWQMANTFVLEIP